MNVTLKKPKPHRVMPLWRDKTEHYKSIVIVENGNPREVVRLRIKYPKSGAGALRVVVWIMSKRNGWQWGTGTASGYGYCKVSAAIAKSYSDAGVVVDRDISGTGEAAILELMQAIAQADTDTLLTDSNILFV